MKKSFLAFITITLLLFLIIPSHALASSHEKHSHDSDLEKTDLQEHIAKESNATVLNNPSNSSKSTAALLYLPCPEGGKHTMVARGTGFIYIDGEQVMEGQTSQCSKCYTVIISENNPFYYWVDSLGTYAEQGHNALVGNPTIMSTDRLYYNSDLSDMQSYVW